MLRRSAESSRRSSYWFQMCFLQRALKKKKKEANRLHAATKRGGKKRGIVVWCVVNKVILQNSSGSLETSPRHLAELKANIDVVLGKWGSLHQLFSPPLCLERFFFSTIHIIWLMFRLPLFLFFFILLCLRLRCVAAGPRGTRRTNCRRLNIFVRFSHRGFN